MRSKLTLTVVEIRDHETGGFTLYLEEYPEVISQGKTKREAFINLLEDLAAVAKMQDRRNCEPL
jgi:predicted RNase H-like HicB family nuclease